MASREFWLKYAIAATPVKTGNVSLYSEKKKKKIIDCRTKVNQIQHSPISPTLWKMHLRIWRETKSSILSFYQNAFFPVKDKNHLLCYGLSII